MADLGILLVLFIVGVIIYHLWSKRSSRQREVEYIVRIDLMEDYHTWLMHSIVRDDTGSIKGCVKTRLQKDEKGYFLRLPYHEARLLRGALVSLEQKLSNEVLQILPDAMHAMKEETDKEQAQASETEDAYTKFLSMDEEKRDMVSLIQVFDYQLCPEEHHPFGSR